MVCRVCVRYIHACVRVRVRVRGVCSVTHTWAPSGGSGRRARRRDSLVHSSPSAIFRVARLAHADGSAGCPPSRAARVRCVVYNGEGPEKGIECE